MSGGRSTNFKISAQARRLQRTRPRSSSSGVQRVVTGGGGSCRAKLGENWHHRPTDRGPLPFLQHLDALLISKLSVFSLVLPSTLPPPPSPDRQLSSNCPSSAKTSSLADRPTNRPRPKLASPFAARSSDTSPKGRPLTLPLHLSSHSLPPVVEEPHQPQPEQEGAQERYQEAQA